jgi:hypothetical protein
MWQQEFLWFFTLFHQEFRKNNPIAFEVLVVLAVAHLCGFYNPKHLADFLDVPHQKFYAELKDWRVYLDNVTLGCIIGFHLAPQTATGRTSPIDQRCDHQLGCLLGRQLRYGQHRLQQLSHVGRRERR